MRPRRDHDVISTRKPKRPIYLVVLDDFQSGRCYRKPGELKLLRDAAWQANRNCRLDLASTFTNEATRLSTTVLMLAS